MAEESDLEKTEPASERRLEKAREEGNVARSRELSTLVMLGTAIGGLWFMAGSVGGTLERAMRKGLAFERNSALDPMQMIAQVGASIMQVLIAVAPLFFAMAAAALVAPMLLGGWLFSGQAIAPKFNKLNPLSGIARMFSSQSLAELLKALAKSLLIGGVAWWVISRNIEEMMQLMALAPSAALPQAVMLVARDCALIAAALVLVAAIDAPWQLWSYHRKLRMSREDLRQEHKESEGDPQIKAQIRRQQQAIARRRMMSEVPKADIVVTNPTHFAVALKYEDGAMRAPRVVAKGTDLIAQRIREIAAENKVPTLEAPPLTRALYKHTRLGDEIPAGLYTAVAEVLAWVYQLKRWHEEGGQSPRTPTALPVPDELAYNPAEAA
ncbi:flagellar biosynthesis protein FlhB [Variovorax dokdonensis]|uniref:Flagellar biosynthetic protein FlhB n=1 Tax=Variovorax dokdonensis TaxID=344883 RepID=A0ABT7N4W1_9BURK|nr:flagellar biosynthesis protein FlhB [Variovorax dokdonensis]MDM0042986.1 flagellar biosynthesis protein FlhB [Variovorax dokdonensis]